MISCSFFFWRETKKEKPIFICLYYLLFHVLQKQNNEDNEEKKLNPIVTVGVQYKRIVRLADIVETWGKINPTLLGEKKETISQIIESGDIFNLLKLVWSFLSIIELRNILHYIHYNQTIYLFSFIFFSLSLLPKVQQGIGFSSNCFKLYQNQKG